MGNQPKLTWELACQIRAEHTGEYGNIAALARKFGVNEATIAKVIKFETWRSSSRNGDAAGSLSENIIHKKIVQLLDTYGRKDMRFFHVANERVCSPRQGRQFKALGVKAGVPDLILVLATGEVRWMEVKRKDGRLSDAQKEWHEFLNQNGQRAVVVYSFEEAVEILTMWGCFRGDLKIAA